MTLHIRSWYLARLEGVDHCNEREQQMTNEAKCELCGEPMPAGEEMFKYHGYSGECPKPPLHKPAAKTRILFPTMLRKMWSGDEVQRWLDEHVNA